MLPNKDKKGVVFLFWRVEQGCVIVNACPFCLMYVSLFFVLIIYFSFPFLF